MAATTVTTCGEAVEDGSDDAQRRFGWRARPDRRGSLQRCAGGGTRAASTAQRPASGAAGADQRGAAVVGRSSRPGPGAQATDRRHPAGAATQSRSGRRHHAGARPRRRRRRPAAERRRSSRPSRRSSTTTPSSPAHRRSAASAASQPLPAEEPLDLEALERRRGRERNGRPVGRYLMCVQVRPTVTQVAVLEGRTLIEHYVSRPADDVTQIHGNIYLGRVQNVLPGHGGGVRRHRHAEERRAVPRRRAVRRRGHRREGRGQPAHRADAQGQAADHQPGDQEPDRGQGRPPHPGGLPARPVRGADPQLEDLRHLQAPARRRAQAPARPSSTGSSRPSTASSCAPPRRTPTSTSCAPTWPGCSSSGRPSRPRPSGPTARPCCTASPSWPCGSSARSSTPSTAA